MRRDLIFCYFVLLGFWFVPQPAGYLCVIFMAGLYLSIAGLHFIPKIGNWNFIPAVTYWALVGILTVLLRDSRYHSLGLSIAQTGAVLSTIFATGLLLNLFGTVERLKAMINQ